MSAKAFMNLFSVKSHGMRAIHGNGYFHEFPIVSLRPIHKNSKIFASGGAWIKNTLAYVVKLIFLNEKNISQMRAELRDALNCRLTVARIRSRSQLETFRQNHAYLLSLLQAVCRIYRDSQNKRSSRIRGIECCVMCCMLLLLRLYSEQSRLVIFYLVFMCFQRNLAIPKHQWHIILEAIN